MRLPSFVTLGSCILTAAMAAILVTGEPAEAQTGSWMCGPITQMGCFAGGSSTCHLGATREENGTLICDPSDPGATDCCKQVNAS